VSSFQHVLRGKEENRFLAQSFSPEACEICPSIKPVCCNLYTGNTSLRLSLD